MSDDFNGNQFNTSFGGDGSMSMPNVTTLATPGIDLDCCGPFENGIPGTPTGSGANCAEIAECCNMCPPDCCDEANFVFNCCNEDDVPAFWSDNVNIEDINLLYGYGGINYENSGYDIPNPLAQALPEFNHEVIKEGGFVFAMATSLPCCEDISVTVTIASCCAEIGGGLTMVGDAILGVDIEIGTCADCDVLTLKSDGTDVAGMTTIDGQGVGGFVLDGGTACTCSLSSGPTDPCTYGGAFRIKQIMPGNIILDVNRAKIIRNAKIMKQKKIRARHKKLMQDKLRKKK